jgi:hypothetical protein
VKFNSSAAATKYSRQLRPVQIWQKARESQVTFAAFNSTKITSVQSTLFGKVLLVLTLTFSDIFLRALMRWPSFSSSTFMTDISGKFACSQDREKVSESVCPQKADLQQESRVFCTCSPILFSTSYVAFAYGARCCARFFRRRAAGMNSRRFSMQPSGIHQANADPDRTYVRSSISLCAPGL